MWFQHLQSDKGSLLGVCENVFDTHSLVGWMAFSQTCGRRVCVCSCFQLYLWGRVQVPAEWSQIRLMVKCMISHIMLAKYKKQCVPVVDRRVGPAPSFYSFPVTIL